MSSEEASSSRIAGEGPRVSIVGIGGAGTNLLGHAIEVGISPTDCVAVNTDKGQLSRSLARNKVLLDQGLFGPTLAENKAGLVKSLQLSAHRVRPYTQDSDLTILITGLGGETGTMTAPLVAQYSRTQIRQVVSVVAIPFIHERERRFIALRGLKRMTEACDCTIVVDNAMEDGLASLDGRRADERASLAVRTLTELISGVEPMFGHEVLRIMSLGPIATICSSYLKLGENIQAGVLDALRSPSANLPLAKTRGAILLHRGPTRMGDGKAAQVYETLVSLIGHRIEFVRGSVQHDSEPMICLLLTGYDYGTAVHAFVDFIEDLYDVEYGQPGQGTVAAFQMPLFQME